LPEVSLTPQAEADLLTNQSAVNYWFTVEEVLENEARRTELFQLLRI
jgi:hypothetical protein